MPTLTSLRTLLEAVRELGLDLMVPLLVYRFGVAVGHFRRVTPPVQIDRTRAPRMRLELFTRPQHPDAFGLDYGQGVIQQAEEIVAGQVRLFGGPPTPLELSSPFADLHWTQAEKLVTGDVKLIWEPARFGWVFPLGLAYSRQPDERYAETFWRCCEQFQAANPVNCGVNWASAQEVALRLIAGVFAAQVFSASPASTPQRMQQLSRWLFEHARRIPPTLLYARAQNNNHLVSEAVGLYLAGVVFAEQPEAHAWRDQGAYWFNRALQRQIAADGEYVQHSTNYQRLMLHLALLFERASRLNGDALEDETRRKLGLAVNWLLAHCDPVSGKAANLGHHDGALLLPLGAGDASDYRPTLQAAARCFLGQPCLPAGAWDELGDWLGLEHGETILKAPAAETPGRVGAKQEWARLRVVQYRSRPAHADQLQVELWCGGRNILIDAGTYSYNRPAPWQNGLAQARVHNAVVVNHQSPMRRAGKYLWLQWDQARLLKDESLEGRRIAAERYGYLNQGVVHQRRLEWVGAGTWNISDRLTPDAKTTACELQLNWLLPDYPWTLQARTLSVRFPEFEVLLSVECAQAAGLRIGLVRAGELVAGEAETDAVLGWISPTYNQLCPALALQINASAALPVEILTRIVIRPLTDRNLG